MFSIESIINYQTITTALNLNGTSQDGYSYNRIFIWGFAPYPTYFFAMMQKSKQKKSRLRLPRSKNYGCGRKKSELAPPSSVLKQQIFFSARCSCFSAHQPMPMVLVSAFNNTICIVLQTFFFLTTNNCSSMKNFLTCPF
jgi:hypothetical protein